MLIRYYENEIFYDPLIVFYKSSFQDSPFPDLDLWRYSLNLAFRYLLNTLISLALIWISFENKNYIKFSVLLFSILFILGLILFWFIANGIQPKDYMVLFYIRRFIIHPILLIVLIPAFYFQKINQKAVK